MKTRIIEIIGPPGIGKSTIYKSLCKNWSPNSNWIYQEELLSHEKPMIIHLRKWVEYHSKKILGKPMTKTIQPDFGLRFINDNPKLASYCWNTLSDHKVYDSYENDKRFRTAYFLFSDFSRYQAILESECIKPCIINEGLLQKSFVIQSDNNLTLDIVNSYIPLLPLPYAIIHIDTPDNNVTLNRLRNRNKVIASHIGKDDPELLFDIEKWRFALNLIQDKIQLNGVNIIKINGEKPVNDNVKYLIKELNAL